MRSVLLECKDFDLDSQQLEYIQMSSIIDDFINTHFYTQQKHDVPTKKQSLINDLSKKLNNSLGSYIYTNTSQSEQCSSIITNHNKEYSMRIINHRQLGCFSILLREVTDNYFKKISSKNLQISCISVLAKIQYLYKSEFVVYLQQGCLSMKLKITYIPLFQNKRKCIEIYKRSIIRNIIEFHNTLASNFKNFKDLISQYENQEGFFNDLSASLLLNNTASNFDYSSDKTNVKINAIALKKQRMEIKTIQDNIICQKHLQNTIYLYHYRQKTCYSQWLKDNLRDMSQSHMRKYKNSLVLGSEQRRKNQINIKVLKVELKEQYKKPFAEGGSCLIYFAKMIVSFVNNEDIFQKQEEKIEKVQKSMAIKSLKPQYENILREKLQHQKQIVARLQNQSSYFIPQYYTTQRQSQLSNSLVMQLINGQQLDSFLRARSLTLSFRTKVYILLNIVFSMRSLIMKQIVHLDMKPINIMVCKQLITKIIDFGQSYHKEVCQKNFTPGFTFPYVAPQVYIKYQHQLIQKKRQDMEYSEKQDAFAFGMIMYEVFFSCKPFNFSIKKYKEVYYERKISQRLFVTPEVLESYQNQYFMFALMHNIERCLEVEHEKRPRFDWMGILFKIILNFLKNH